MFQIVKSIKKALLLWYDRPHRSLQTKRVIETDCRPPRLHAESIWNRDQTCLSYQTSNKLYYHLSALSFTNFQIGMNKGVAVKNGSINATTKICIMPGRRTLQLREARYLLNIARIELISMGMGQHAFDFNNNSNIREYW